MEDELNYGKLYAAYLNYEKYKKTHNTQVKKWYDKMRQDPEKYTLYLERRKNQYKQKREAAKQQNESPPIL